jgi:hypothetical protein
VLRPDNSYDVPDFVHRGYYEDLPFRCKDCAVEEVWSARQQQWWYETARGDVWTTAIRCRACRRKDRDRREKARRAQIAGAAAKSAGDA